MDSFERNGISLEKINIREKLALFDEYWTPKIAGELNGQHVKLVKLSGEFVWHKHDDEDELFLVIQGALSIQFRERTVQIEEGEFIIVPRGIEHCPRADSEVHVLVFEPIGTLNTGDAISDKMVPELDEI
ncbi:MAG: mannose-6-phosphate isomerase-like protein (cupin superfamily) [Candidatus Latescibacterota bacterium]